MRGKVLILLFVLSFSIIPFSKAQDCSKNYPDGAGTFFFSGGKDYKGDIKRNIVFQYLRHKKGFDEFIAFYIAHNYNPDVLIPGGISYSVTSSLDVINIIKSGRFDQLLNNECVQEFLPSRDELEDEVIRDFLLSKYDQLKGVCIKWAVDGSKVNCRLIDSIFQSLTPLWSNVREVAVFIAIPEENIKLDESNLSINRQFNRNATDIREDIVKILRNSNYLKGLFTNKGFKVPERYNTPKDAGFYPEDYITVDREDIRGSRISSPEVLYYNGFEYYLFVRINHLELYLVADQSGGYKWKATFNFDVLLRNISETDVLAATSHSFSFKVVDNSMYSYHNVINKFLKTIYSYLLFEPIVIGSDATKKEYFKQWYLNIGNYAYTPGLESTKGFNFDIYVMNVNDDRALSGLLNRLRSNYNFEKSEVSLRSQGVLAELIKCRFSINQFMDDLIINLNSLNIGQFRKYNSPYFYPLLTPYSGVPCCICNSNTAVCRCDLECAGIEHNITQRDVSVFNNMTLEQLQILVMIGPVLEGGHHIIRFKVSNCSPGDELLIQIKDKSIVCQCK